MLASKPFDFNKKVGCFQLISASVGADASGKTAGVTQATNTARTEEQTPLLLLNILCMRVKLTLQLPELCGGDGGSNLRVLKWDEANGGSDCGNIQQKDSSGRLVSHTTSAP